MSCPEQTLVVPLPVLKSIYKLTNLDVEVTGYITFDKAGKTNMVKMNNDSKVLSTSPPGYDVVFHTHPNDYKRLFPDHPSVIDVETTNYIICTREETQAHLIFTPKFLYILKGACVLMPENEDPMSPQQIFNACGRAHPDRNSQSFRDCYLGTLQSRGLIRYRKIPWDSMTGDLSLCVEHVSYWRDWLRVHRNVVFASVAGLLVLGFVALTPKRS